MRGVYYSVTGYPPSPPQFLGIIGLGMANIYLTHIALACILGIAVTGLLVGFLVGVAHFERDFFGIGDFPRGELQSAGCALI